MAELVDQKLAAFVADSNGRPWHPSSIDCCIVLAAWAMWMGRSDPAQHLRGLYDTEDGFRRIIVSANGLVPVVEACVSTINGLPVFRPSCGDVGVIGSPTNIHRQFGAIHDGRRWLVRMRNGFAPVTAKTLAAWKI